MPVDTSIYTPVQQPNALQQFGQMAATVNALNQNKLFPLVQQSSELGVQGQGIANQTAQIAQRKAQLELAQNQQGMMISGLTAAATDPQLTRAKLVQMGQTYVKEFGLPQSALDDEIKNMPQTDDPAALQTYAKTLAARQMAAAEQAGFVFGTPGTQNVGGKIQPVLSSPAFGVKTAGAGNPLTVGLSPDTAAQPTTVTGPNGVQVQTTIGGYNKLMGNGDPQDPANYPSAGTILPGSGPPVQAQPLQPVQPQTPPTPGMTQLAPGVKGIAGPVPGQVEAATAVGKISGDQLASARIESANLKQGTFPLMQAIPALERLGTTGTGPGTETIQQIRSFAQSMGIPLPAASGDATKDYDEARKYLTDFVNKNGNTGTNDKLAASFAGSPSVNISNAAAADVAKSAVSLARMKAVMPIAFDKTGLPEAQYNKWLSEQSQSQDPRAFGLDMMKPEVRSKLIAGIKAMPADSTERGNFLKSLRMAVDAGVISPPGATNAAQ